MNKPEIIDQEKSIIAKWGGGLDYDSDGTMSVKYGVFVEIDKEEAIDEAKKKLVSDPRVPQAVKDFLK